MERLYESILFRWERGRRSDRIRPFAVRWHKSAGAARRAAEAAVPGEASGAIAVRLDPPETLDTPPREVVLHRVGTLPPGV